MIKIKIGTKMKGSAVLILDDEDRLLILLRSKGAHWMPQKWGLPGGRIERGENAAGAAIRETKEETDLDIDVADMVPMPMHSNKAVPPICTPSGIYVKKFPSYTDVRLKATTIAAIRKMPNSGSDHF